MRKGSILNWIGGVLTAVGAAFSEWAWSRRLGEPLLARFMTWRQIMIAAGAELNEVLQDAMDHCTDCELKDDCVLGMELEQFREREQASQQLH